MFNFIVLSVCLLIFTTVFPDGHVDGQVNTCPPSDVFVDDGIWMTQDGISPTEYQYFGKHVSISGRTMMVGFTEYGEAGVSKGAVIVYWLNDLAIWERIPGESGILQPSDASVERFGQVVDVKGTLSAVVACCSFGVEAGVFIFTATALDSNDWVEQQVIKPSYNADWRQFNSVAVSSNRHVVIGGHEALNPSNDRVASLIIFEETSPNLWSPVYLDTRGSSTTTQVGTCVAVYENKVAAGDPWDSTYLAEQGAVLVYHRDIGGVWNNVAVLGGNNADAGEGCGWTRRGVAISDEFVVLGCHYDDEQYYSGGSVYLFEEVSAGTYAQFQHIYPSDQSDMISQSSTDARQLAFGLAVAIHQGSLLIGAPYDSTLGSSMWSHSNGAMYLYQIASDESEFIEIEKILSTSAGIYGEQLSYLGYSVAISEVFVVGGAYEYNPVYPTPPSEGAVMILSLNCNIDVSSCSSAPCPSAVTCNNDLGGGGYTCNICESSPCDNSGICADEGGNIFTCNCTGTGYEGETCSSDIDDCESSPCTNSGVCADAGANSFLCDCTGTGYQGVLCETDVDDCESSPCANSGICADAGANVFTCNCTGTGYEGETCSSDIDDCESSPCTNSGVCADAGANSFLCACTGTGYEGVLCETDIDDCESSPCANSGVCADAGARAFTCDCTDTGYEGETCSSDIDDCESSPCTNSGVCADAGANAFLCDCTGTGYEGVLCETDVDDCLSSPCFNSGSCTDGGVNVFQCSCIVGFEGTVCETSLDDPLDDQLDDGCSSSPCLNGGTCVDGIANVTCICAAGYEGDVCHVDTDDCVSMPCTNGETCVDALAAFACIAPLNPCLSAPCMNGGLCWVAASHSTFTCDCTDEYQGVVCEAIFVQQSDPLKVVVVFKTLANNATLIDVVTSLPFAITASQNHATNNEVVIVGITVPNGYMVSEDLPVPVEQTGNSFSITIQYANSEQVGEVEVRRRIEASNTPNLVDRFSTDVKVAREPMSDDLEEDDDAAENDNEMLYIIIIALLVLIGATACGYFYSKQQSAKSSFSMPT